MGSNGTDCYPPPRHPENGTWYTYGHDLTKNVTELYNADGTIATTYDYTPFGAVTATGTEQAFQWSSEVYDEELALTYYNYRHYNSIDGRWIGRDPIEEDDDFHLYSFTQNNGIEFIDALGDQKITPFRRWRSAKGFRRQTQKNPPKTEKKQETPPSPEATSKPTEYFAPKSSNITPIGCSILEDILDALTGGVDCEKIQYTAAARQCDQQRSTMKCPKCCVIYTYCKDDPHHEYASNPAVGFLTTQSCDTARYAGYMGNG